MGVVNINVDPAKLLEFANYVSEFAGKLNGECNEISGATSRLASTMDSNSVSAIQNASNEIAQILEESKPVLKDLQQQVEQYAAVVRRLREIAGQS